ncbi:hypothetical protein lacNasYZ03_11910 [Lactobacillus nasalidis]|uniref:Beta-carotene 15,15'-monooxygenase n=1 Tax=Lactobacillus nasalidis TaxID=2797258 RepID=A0ABQ3W6Y6_9LACO|nr:hypothetical protein [Lactobacillus nasalidis]GHV97288.1 hypothetical protein lacNasYZ01_04700 [Lactobacillus nasalidis]GHW00041.1 hypothetical protein lacNasYZ02_14700 [Lactobacillus nasalidis]GHW01504.1 hypothetical protein lacNasYZ03_11910 [Lactobacillus nasalidis]
MQAKQTIYRIFHPNKWLLAVICVSATALLNAVFSYNLKHTPLAQVAYWYSLYALIVFIIAFVRGCRKLSRLVKEKSRLYRFYQDNIRIFHKYSLLVGFSVNFAYGLLKLAAGVYYSSWWFVTLAVYYLLLCSMKVTLLKNLKSPLKKQLLRLKHVGLALLAMDVVLAGIIILIVSARQVFYYYGYLIYLMALYDFYLITMAFINVFKYRRHSDVVVFASKCINLTVAMISMISLEVAMIYTFGHNDSKMKTVMTLCLGVVVVVVNSIMATSLIIKAQKGLKKQD